MEGFKSSLAVKPQETCDDLRKQLEDSKATIFNLEEERATFRNQICKLEDLVQKLEDEKSSLLTAIGLLVQDEGKQLDTNNARSPKDCLADESPAHEWQTVKSKNKKSNNSGWQNKQTVTKGN